jgi:hypothetical protein
MCETAENRKTAPSTVTEILMVFSPTLLILLFSRPFRFLNCAQTVLELKRE